MPSQKNIENVKELTEKLVNAKSIYFTDYLGLDVSDITDLRKAFFNGKVEYIVVKNTLLKIASSESNIELDDSLFSGSTAIALSYEEPVAAAKIIKGFLKDHDLPLVKGVFIEGNFLDGSEFDKIADLPSKDESITKLTIMLKSPVQNLAMLLESPLIKLIHVLQDLKKNKN